MTEVPISRRIRNKAGDIRRRFSARVRGTKHYEKEWAQKEYDQQYWDSMNHPHRDLVISTISKYSPESILEIGCNSGPNLFRIARRFPSAKLRGIDINHQAIEAGNRLLAESSINNVKLEVGKADDLRAFSDGSFDIVLTDAVLIYIGKDKIKAMTEEMLRVAKKAIVLIEWHDPESGAEGALVKKKGYWARDYIALFKSREKVVEVKLTKIGREVWDDNYWSSLGNVVEVVLKA